MSHATPNHHYDAAVNSEQPVHMEGTGEACCTGVYLRHVFDLEFLFEDSSMHFHSHHLTKGTRDISAFCCRKVISAYPPPTFNGEYALARIWNVWGTFRERLPAGNAFACSAGPHSSLAAPPGHRTRII